MVQPVRCKKPINYSQFGDSDSDDDFVSATVPLNKQSRTSKELKQDKPKPNLNNLQKEEIPLEEKTPKKKRMALDDKLYQRDLEVALALSVKELSTVTTNVQKSQDKRVEKHGNSRTETVSKSPHISNCSVASDYLDLDKITKKDNGGIQGKRKAASKAAVQQRKIFLEGSDGNSANNTKPDLATGEDSEDDSDFGESEDNDKDSSMRKSKKRKEMKVKSPVEKKEKESKSKCNDTALAAIKSESQSSPKEIYLSSDATRKPLQICSPSAESKRPKCSSNSSSALAGVSMKSPNQSLCCGLSRSAPVKPLHPNATRG
uniref:RAD51 interacting motif domain-containing protein n=1 Tax=Pan troglodytes TaxID=9598 RepID=A0A2I3SFG3_PANTR